MTKEELIERFYKNHKAFTSYIIDLTDDEFIYSRNDKWTPGQQLEHIYLCLEPLAKVLSAKPFIEQKFGTINRPVLGYADIISNYKISLEKGGKAPEKFVPSKVELSRKAELINGTNEILKTISQHLNAYTEAELDRLILPHPLLGGLAIREMFYLMAYHAMHHLDQVKQNSQNSASH